MGLFHPAPRDTQESPAGAGIKTSGMATEYIRFEFMKQHKVRGGECLASIAAQYGFSVDTIWNLADNASLKDKRKDPNTLVPGDVVVIPDRREKVVSCATAQTHKFKLSAASALFRVQLF